jgi:hypothetical protein
MSRFTSFFVLTGYALSATPVVDFRTALSYFADDSLWANITVSSSRGAPLIRGKLTDGAMYIVATSAAEEGPATLSFSHVEHAPLVFDVEAPEPIYVSPPSSSYIGIGAASALVQRVGAVAVIKGLTRSAELVLGSTMEYFNTTCVPNTLMSLNFSSDSLRITAKLIDGSGNQVGVFGDHQLVVDGPGSYRATVPSAMYGRIDEILIAGGCGRDSEILPARFSGCSRAIIESLPSIDFTTPVGSIVYFPEDYIDFNAADNTCRLRVMRARDGAALAFSPLLLVDTNVRVTRDNQWSICESAATF